MSEVKSKGQTMELSISGHQVCLSFAQEQNPTVAQQIRASLIDSYIRQHGLTDEEKA